ncbi:MAG TPA: carbon storage regulator [Isosphaeraceae bacterium]|nr:carbon storage regulator [Isosphaeraceae bacterium]
MLVLSRKLDETIIINGDIRVRVLGIRGNLVRLGIEAPNCYTILRQELLDDPEAANPPRRRQAAPA